MKNILKWLLITGGVFLVLIIAAVIIIPQVIDVQKYKPTIEQKVAQATGRSFTLGDEMDISVFPWVGVKLTDLHLGNPAGYRENDMISVKDFEVRLKVMPLLSKRIEVKTFILDTPVIYLEKLKNGKANWQGIGKQQEKKEIQEKTEKPSTDRGLPITDLMVGNFSITNGQLIYVDQGTNLKKEISDLNLNLGNLSLENPVDISLSAKVDGKPVSLDGTAGPIGKEPGKGTIALDFVLKALEDLEVSLTGNLIDVLVGRTFDLELDVAAFSPRKLFAALDQNFPVQTKDPAVLNAVSFKARLTGNPKSVSLSDGVFLLDDSKLIFSASAKAFSKPDLKFDIQLDGIDLDRYLPEPPPKETTRRPGEATPEKIEPAKTAPAKKKTDYGPLRKLVLDGKVKVDKLKAHGATIENLDVHILAKNGIVKIDPLGLNLYQGNISSTVELNVQKNDPRTKMTLEANGIQAGPLMKDALQKELIEGTLKADLGLSMTGETPDMIKQTLTGQGELLFVDGAIVGIDLAGMVRNIKTSFGMGEQLQEKPRTDFAELKIPFTAKNGLVNTRGTSLISPLIRTLATGNVNLVKELLDLRVEPKFVTTLKGQGDTLARSGVMVPVLITGSFSSPKIRPDLQGMLSGGIPDAKGLKEVLGTKEDQKQKIESVKEELENQIKGLFPGLTN